MNWLMVAPAHYELHVGNRVEAEVQYRDGIWRWSVGPQRYRHSRTGWVTQGRAETLEAAREMVMTLVGLAREGRL